MTAFARAETQVGRGRMAVEIRSVNHRHLQPGFHLPRECAELEPAWREQLRTVCARGKIDVAVHFRRAGEEVQRERLNTPQLRRLLSVSRRWFPYAEADRILALSAAWSTVPPTADGTLASAAQEAYRNALEAFVRQREREGERLANMLREQLQTVAEHVAGLRTRRPVVQQALRERWQTRLQELQASVEARRLEEEIAVQVMRADVDEELTRLDSHIQEAEAALEAPGPQGRKLDFLMQEFAREANTLASKAPDIETTNAALAIKVTVEQMREQVQNLE